MGRRGKKAEEFFKGLGNNLRWSLRGVAPTRQTANVKHWCNDNAAIASYIELDPWNSIDYPPRPSFGDQESFRTAILQNPDIDSGVLLKEMDAAAHLPGSNPALARIEKGRVFSDWAIAFTPEDQLLPDTNFGTLAGTDDSIQPRYHGRLSPAKQVSGSVGILASYPARRNYFHWMIDILPKLYQFRDAGVQPDYFFTHTSQPYHRDFLMLLGIENDRIIPAEPHAHIQSDELFIATKLFGPMRSQSADFLFESMDRQPWSQVNATDRLRILVSREHCQWRKVTNETELLKQLEPLGFQLVVLERLPLREQIQLFQQADFVVGPHGAGLANVVFSPSSANLLEFGTPFRPNPCMYHVACARGLQYRFYYAKPVEGRREESHIEVDVGAVVGEISRMLGK